MIITNFKIRFQIFLNLSLMKKVILAIVSLILCIHISNAQNWIDLKQNGANYNDVKRAFLNQYGSKISQFRKEAPAEAKIGKNRKDDDFEQQMEGIIHFMRWSNEVEPRVATFNGDINAMHAANAEALFKQNSTAQTRAASSWSLLGPTNTPTNGGNGRVSGVRALPGSTTTLFACTPAGGIFKTTNGGTSWSPITDAIAVLGATDLAIDPTNTNIMYLATGDGDAGDARSTGVYKSIDGGVTWAATGLTFTTSQSKLLSRILIDPTSKKLIAGGNSGIYTSIDAGATWVQTSTLAIRDLDFKPGTTTTIYAGGYGANIFLRSTDAGATWQNTGTGLPTSGTQRVAVGVTSLDPTYVYCLIANSTDYGFKGLYLSTDGGSTFTLKSSTPNILGWNSNGGDAGGQGWYDLSIAVDPANKNTIYTGGVNCWKSTTSGATWTIAAHWSGSGAPYIHADNHDLIFIGNTLFAANDGGVFCTSNGGTTWSDKSANLANAQIYSIGLSATNANVIISGHQDNGTNLTNNLSTWTEVNGGDGFVCFIDRSTDTRQFSSIYYGALYRSTNSGASFSSLYTVTGGGWVTPWLQDPTTAATLYAAGTNVVKSTTSGSSWSNISTFASSVGTIVSIDVAKTSSNYIAAASKSILMTTTDGGITWVNKSTGLPTGVSILKVSYDLASSTTMYVNLASYSGASVYKTTDGGTTWVNFSAGLPNIPASALALQSNGDMYCGTDIGVYYRATNATSWTSCTAGMPGVPVRDLKIFAPTGKLRAATFGRGIWEMDLKSFTSPPSIAITSPTTGSSFSSPATVAIAATASAGSGTISKVEFYSGSALLTTSTTAPYTYSWQNVVTGNYTIKAKVYNSNNQTALDSVNITVKFSNDAGVASITTPTTTISAASFTPQFSIHNYGSNTLTSAALSASVDNVVKSTLNWTGSLTAGSEILVALPSVTGYATGLHTFTATIGLVNGATDPNTSNNTLQSAFTYSACTNSFEPNDLSTQAATLTVGTPISSQIATTTDVDYYKFVTTLASPKIRVTLTTLPADYDLTLYNSKANGTIGGQIGASANGGTTNEIIVNDVVTAATTYYIKVIGYNGAHSTTACYTLLAETKSTNYVRGTNQDAFVKNNLVNANSLQLFPNPTDNDVRVVYEAEADGTYDIALIDLLGRRVLNAQQQFIKGTNEQQVNLNTVSSGVYLVRISSSNTAESKTALLKISKN